MGTQRKRSSTRKGKKARTAPAYPFEFRLKVVKRHLEDGYPAKLVAEQFDVSNFSVSRWAKLYREQGEQGLRNRQRKPSGSKVPAAVTRSIVDLKKENPGYGIKRIGDVLRRFFWVKASPSTVQRTLRDNGLNTPVKKKAKKNPAKPRFFERARPNQMWQSDILTFRLGDVGDGTSGTGMKLCVSIKNCMIRKTC